MSDTSLRDTEAMRALWCAVIEAFVEDTRVQIAAARRGKSNVWISSRPTQIVSEDRVIAEAKRFLRSRWFGQIADFAGLDADPERIMSGILAGVPVVSGARR